MARKVDSKAAVTLTVACVRCGQPIVLVAREDSVEIPDRAEFMRLHSDCLTEQPLASNGASSGHPEASGA